MARENKANQPPTRAELAQIYNLEAAMVWREDGYYIDWSLIDTETPMRIREWDRVFWAKVDPAFCHCGEPVDFHGAECLRCRLEPFGSEWQREQDDRDGVNWMRNHPLA